MKCRDRIKPTSTICFNDLVWFGLVWFLFSNTLASLAGYIHYIHNPAEKKMYPRAVEPIQGVTHQTGLQTRRLCHKASANSAIN